MQHRGRIKKASSQDTGDIKKLLRVDRAMQVQIELPADISQALQERWWDVPRRTLEALAIEGSRAGALTESQLRRMLGYETGLEVHVFLRQAGMPPHYTAADLADDFAAHRTLGSFTSLMIVIADTTLQQHVD
jgi:Uncharacterised protein family (UPF0175)